MENMNDNDNWAVFSTADGFEVRRYDGAGGWHRAAGNFATMEAAGQWVELIAPAPSGDE